MFKYENVVKGKMDIEKLWELYSNVDNWAEWDKSVQKVELKNSFATGTKGTLFMNNVPPLPFVLNEVVKNEKFIDTAVLGDIIVQFGHYIIEEINSEYTLKHTVTITGGNDNQIKGIGQGIVVDIPESMENLYQLSRKDK